MLAFNCVTSHTCAQPARLEERPPGAVQTLEGFSGMQVNRARAVWTRLHGDYLCSSSSGSAMCASTLSGAGVFLNQPPPTP